MEEFDRDAGEVVLRGGGCPGVLFSLANSKLLRQNALQPRARHRSRALVDHSIAAAADSFHDLRAIVICSRAPKFACKIKAAHCKEQ
jgi:hypothetical protein